MKKLLEKKQWAMLSLVAALGVAVYLNYYFTKEPALQSGTQPTSTSSTTAGEGETSDTEPSAAHLGEASYVNSTVSGAAKQTGSTTSAGTDYFKAARASRTAAREEAARTLAEIVNNAQATAEAREEAGKKAAAIAENVLAESNIENLILAKGFADCVAFIDEEHCSVVVAGNDLQQTESLQILEIVLSQCHIGAQNVKITAVKA